MNDNNKQKIDLKKAILNSQNPQGDLKAPKRRQGAPNKPVDEVIHKRVAIPFTRPEYEMLMAEMERLKEATPGVAFTETSVAKIGVIKYLKGREK